MARVYQSIDRNSKFYQMYVQGKALHVDLHPNTSSGGFFSIKDVAEGEALVARLMEGVDALRTETGQREDADVPIPPSAEGQGS